MIRSDETQKAPRVTIMRGVVSFLVLLMPTLVRADKVSGTWTGEVEVLGNYYWERSTRVVAPEVTVRTDAPDGTTFHAGYLIDAITSASLATGAVTDNRFTEMRHDVQFGVGHEFEIDDSGTTLTLDASAGLSTEPDYQSANGTFSTSLGLDHEATILRVSASFLHDDVGKILRGADRTSGGDGRDLSNRGEVGELEAWLFNFGWDQVLAPNISGSLSYDLGVLNGFQENPYRMVPVGGIAISENHPDERIRHTASGRIAWYIPETGTALHAMHRAYLDSWSVAAISPEVRVYQEIGSNLNLRLRYRYYTQTRSEFFKAAADYTSEDLYVTTDPKMSKFHSQLFGVESRLALHFLDGSALGFASEGSITMNFEYLWNTNRYGNGILAQAGLNFPF